MPDNSHETRRVTLPLTREEEWTLHHVLLDQIVQESIAEETSCDDTPPAGVYQAFESLDTGETTFTIDQLRAVHKTLTEYLHTTETENIEYTRIEQIHHHISERLDDHNAAPSAE